jgi:probable F420-dependent oxidoreductase
MSIAEATATLRIGTLVLDNDFRHPALVASEAATLDVLSDGRFELGMGAGWDRSDYDVSGIPFEAPKVRVSRLEESVQVVRRLLSEHPVTCEGTHYTVHGLTNAPRPVQRPHPPILIGGGGRRVLSVAAREADIVSVMPTGLGMDSMPDLRASSMRRGVDHVRTEAGTRFEHIELNTLLQRLVITDNTHQAAEELAVQWQMTVDEALDTPWALIGTVDQVVDTLRERRERFGLSYWVVHDRYMDAFAPVVTRLAGS